MGKSKQRHFENGAIEQLRDNALPVDKKILKSALKESKKNKNPSKTIFSKLKKTEVKKLLAL